MNRDTWQRSLAYQAAILEATENSAGRTCKALEALSTDGSLAEQDGERCCRSVPTIGGPGNVGSMECSVSPPQITPSPPSQES